MRATKRPFSFFQKVKLKPLYKNRLKKLCPVCLSVGKVFSEKNSPTENLLKIETNQFVVVYH